MLELFKGQLDLDTIKNKIPYKEAYLLREVRVDRLKKEKEDMEKAQKAEADRQRNEAARNKIHISKR